eukprot:gb/GECG01002198.1/.p1 GENE.gb/GECG01002198.1/~~gb/GECG01002198.1/.p1  ORF type:complete len:140 (+),score=9.69 gb/GECG01002198.1/:1-420(+)
MYPLWVPGFLGSFSNRSPLTRATFFPFDTGLSARKIGGVQKRCVVLELLLVFLLELFILTKQARYSWRRGTRLYGLETHACFCNYCCFFDSSSVSFSDTLSTIKYPPSSGDNSVHSSRRAYSVDSSDGSFPDKLGVLVQ